MYMIKWKMHVLYMKMLEYTNIIAVKFVMIRMRYD